MRRRCATFKVLSHSAFAIITDVSLPFTRVDDRIRFFVELYVFTVFMHHFLHGGRSGEIL